MKNIARTIGLFLLAVSFAAPASATSWPQELPTKSGGSVLIYQPQIEEFTDNRLAGRAAIAYKETEESAPVFGAIWFESKIDTNRDTRTADIRDIDVTDVRFADSTDAQKDAIADFIESSVESSTMEISVDQLLAGLDASGASVSEPDLKHDAPIMILSREPALLVSIDGDPVLQDIEGSDYERVVNTAYLIVKDGKTHYLYIGSNAWYQSKNVTEGWSVASTVPADIKSLVEPAEPDGSDLSNVKIVVATDATELLVSDGPPSWTPIEGMNLLYMDNTDSSAFLELSTQRYYVLLSGRWYRSEGVEGEIEWEHVPNDQLPEPFGDIPPDSPSAEVLSQVSGTQQARDAVLDNTIPQTAAINRDDTSFDPSYDGEPDFAPIEDIQVEYAQNTTEAIFKYGNRYYACKDGVWYTATSPEGPWGVAAEVPDAIYDIPTSNPHYNVTYVKVYDVTPEVVYVGYTPGYYGSYYYSGTVVYGSGWYYRPWYGPYYYPRYPTWGFHVTYNPWTGWGLGVSWTNGPFRFTFHGRGGYWGPVYRPRPRPRPRPDFHGGNNRPGDGNRPGNGDGNRPEARPNVYDRPENKARNAERPATADNRQAARPANNAENNVLADKSGNVYQRGSNGDWSQRDNGQWTQPSNMDRSNSADRANTANTANTANRANTANTANTANRASQQPSYNRSSSGATRPQLERDYSSRQHGAQRSQNYQRQRSAPSRRR